MKTVCEVNKCTGCQACVDICPKHAVSISDTMKDLNAIIDEKKCILCGACERVCQQIHPMELKKPLEWFQGWSNDASSRARSSSGGFAYQLMKQFIKDGGLVCSCIFDNGMFRYKLADSEGELEAFRGSKYVKSNPKGVYDAVKRRLMDSCDVLFIGLPCHVAGLKRFVGSRFDDGLYTVDLICHGSPSQKLLKKYLAENSIPLDRICNITFRQKNKFRLITEVSEQRKEVILTPPGVRDRYTIGFLNGLFYTSNCYSCRYAQLYRASDITLGDSWGSELEDTEEGSRGISLALCQTKKGVSLLKKSGLNLLSVDLDRAAEANHQLRQPMVEPVERALFFDRIEAGKTVSSAVAKCYPKICIRQDIKTILIKLHLKRDKGV